MARGAFPDSHPQHLGMPGMHGTVAAVDRAAEGRPDRHPRRPLRRPGHRQAVDASRRDAKIVHADIDPAEIGKNRTADVPIVGDCREVIADLIVAVQAEHDAGRRGDYAGLVGAARRLARDLPAGLRASPTTARCRRSTSSSGSASIAGPDAIYVAGVGQHQMWAAQFISLREPGHLAQLRRRSARWATRCRPRWAPRSAARTRRSGRSTATAASR